MISYLEINNFAPPKILYFYSSECVTQIGSKTATGAVAGTCVASSECTSDGGVADGNCADGFGVCCVHK